jgi:DNA-binding transcriptional LysR family regulator
MADLPFTLDQLRILRAIASEGSFKKAADSLYVTQPAVSLQIQNLEKQLDVSLFDRGGRKAQLTEAGHLLLSYCDRILSQCQEACRALDDLHNLRGGSLIVGASASGIVRASHSRSARSEAVRLSSAGGQATNQPSSSLSLAADEGWAALRLGMGSAGSLNREVGDTESDAGCCAAPRWLELLAAM